MADYIVRWFWHSFGIFVLIFVVLMFLILGKSYTIEDFSTRSNQFTQRILLYAGEDGQYELSDFADEKITDIIGGIEEVSETFSLRIEIKRTGKNVLLDKDEEPWEKEPNYYAQNTFERQEPIVLLSKAYEQRKTVRNIYLSDTQQNAQLVFTYIYKR